MTDCAAALQRRCKKRVGAGTCPCLNPAGDFLLGIFVGEAASDASTGKLCDLDALDTDGTSPLCAAVTWGFEPIVRVLVDAGCDVNVRNNGTQTTALQVAAIQENGKIAHMLLQAGADPTLEDVLGRSSCDFASPSASTWPLFAARGLARTPKDELIRKGVIRKVAQVETEDGGGRGAARLPSGAVPFYSRPGSAYVVAGPDQPSRTSSTAHLPSVCEFGVDPLGEMDDEGGDTRG